METRDSVRGSFTDNGRRSGLSMTSITHINGTRSRSVDIKVTTEHQVGFLRRTFEQTLSWSGSVTGIPEDPVFRKRIFFKSEGGRVEIGVSHFPPHEFQAAVDTVKAFEKRFSPMATFFNAHTKRA